MNTPLDIDYRHVNKTDALEALIRRRVEKLDRVADRLSSCHVSVEKPNQHQDSGRPYRVRVVLHHPPGKELVVDRGSSGGDVHEEVHQVVEEVFDAAERKLKKMLDKMHGKVKSHPHQQPTAVVMDVDREARRGRLRSLEGEELFFDDLSSADDFDHLDIGDGVSFVKENGEDGPFASAVRVEYKVTL